MISVKAFLAGVQAICNTHPTYRIGGTGKDGTCDCVGLVMGAVTRAGGKWKWLHSSNECRSYMRTMHPLTSADQLLPGMLVHKSRPPGSKGYSLPSRYTGTDQLDYYHVGIVTQTNPLRITHCTSWSGGSGIKQVSTIRGWQWYGECQAVEPVYGSEPLQGDEPLRGGLDSEGVSDMTYKVIAERGDTVNLREKPGGRILDKVPVGATVESDGDASEEWLKVVWTERHEGYMMTEFLEEVGGETNGAD